MARISTIRELGNLKGAFVFLGFETVSIIDKGSPAVVKLDESLKNPEVVSPVPQGLTGHFRIVSYDLWIEHSNPLLKLLPAEGRKIVGG
jgi:hypothetical protein